MAKLISKKDQNVICQKVHVAKTIWARTRGLLGTQSLPKRECLWIHKCNSIHTWFMNYPIDVIFVDKELKVIKTYKNLKPWKITFPKFNASSVFEMQAGWLDNNCPQEGEQLYVDA